jgi:hypothetical protein
MAAACFASYSPDKSLTHLEINSSRVSNGVRSGIGILFVFIDFSEVYYGLGTNIDAGDDNPIT